MNVGLQTRHTPEKHTSENLKTLFKIAFSEWNLGDKEVSGVVDNAKASLRLGSFLKDSPLTVLPIQ